MDSWNQFLFDWFVMYILGIDASLKSKENDFIKENTTMPRNTPLALSQKSFEQSLFLTRSPTPPCRVDTTIMASKTFNYIIINNMNAPSGVAVSTLFQGTCDDVQRERAHCDRKL